ncbi:MAG: RagB/SusD family nutrient uptake outer membrane protein [Chitinophagaceae bacterium]|nr:MAG: RagB/SusD family nutrient uptake outer membrane protein [Chitinophagaceae bacterium]
MKNIALKTLLVTSGIVGLVACKKDFLKISPLGSLDETTLSTEKGVNTILLSAYAMLDGHDGSFGVLGNEWGSGGSNFVFGSMAGGEANRGSSPGDQASNMVPQIRHEGTAASGSLNDRWKALYEGVKRTNTVLQILAKVEGISDANRANVAGQARLLRAWYHFQARITYGEVPYLDETIDASLASGAINGVPNDHDIFPEILADAKYAYENLPGLQDAPGRINKWCAGALYGKILMFAKDYPTARTVLTDVVANGTTPAGVKYDLNPNYGDNFDVDKDNSIESVFAFQASSQDNAGARNGNWGDQLNFPANGGIGGGGFFCPTYYFVNNFKTDALGLPLANPENNQVMDPAGQAGLTLYASTLDTRLDWTIGRNGVPFHDWGTAQTSWQRDPTCGPYLAKKGVIRQSQVAASHDASIWFSAGGSAINMNLIRFSDVILLLAEAEIESGTLLTAFNLINRVRARAATTAVVPFPTTFGVPKTAPYPVLFASQDAARTAVRLERLLELGMEGHRFFDLVRWGVAQTELNSFYNYETALPYQALGDLNNPKAQYSGPERDYYDLPQRQIDLSNGTLTP